MIQALPDRIIISRQVYDITEWLQEVGGFAGSIHLILTLLVPLFKVWGIEKHFVSKLYKT